LAPTLQDFDNRLMPNPATAKIVVLAKWPARRGQPHAFGQPHASQYGFLVGGPVGKKQFLSFEGGQRKLRGMVNGNVLVPREDEREPLTADPAKAALIRRFLAAYGTELPNRLDLDLRALNTNLTFGWSASYRRQ